MSIDQNIEVRESVPIKDIEVMIATATRYRYLSPNPKSAYKQLFVSGTRIRAQVLFGWFAGDEPMTPEEIAADYRLPVAAVEEAIAYCESQPLELEEDYSREEALMQATGMNEPNYKDHPVPKLLSPREREQLKQS